MRVRIAYHCNYHQPVLITDVWDQPSFYIPTRREALRESLIAVRDELIACRDILLGHSQPANVSTHSFNGDFA